VNDASTNREYWQVWCTKTNPHSSDVDKRCKLPYLSAEYEDRAEALRSADNWCKASGHDYEVRSSLQAPRDTPSPIATGGAYEALGREVGALVDEKQAAYGDSFGKSAEYLRILYPNGVPPEKYQDMLCLVRIFDKAMRLATKKDAFGESPYRDIAGYGLLGVKADGRR